MKKLKVELQKLQSSMKKTSVLNLEVEAYEKSLKEMNQKLETNSKQMTDVTIQAHLLGRYYCFTYF